MKKILRVTIKKVRTEDKCHFEYPEQWDSQKVHVLAYEDNPDDLGEVEEDCLCITDEETAEKLLESPDCKVISKAKANAFGRKWRPRIANITDDRKVTQFAKKLLTKPAVVQFLHEHFSQEEIDSIDETKATSGIEKGKEFNIEDFI